MPVTLSSAPYVLLEEAGTTLAYQAYMRLRHDIVNAAFAPGARLRTRSLCERYEVGLAPVREALTRLSSEGLVVQSSRRGFAVPAFGRAHLEELTRTCCWLHSLALRASIDYADPTWEAALSLAFHRLQALPRESQIDGVAAFSPAWEAAHGQYHRALIGGCRSTWITNLCGQVFEAMNYYRHHSRQTEDVLRHQADLQTEDASQHQSDEHTQVFEAVMARDAERATQLITAHFTRTAAIVIARMEASEPRAAEGISTGPVLV